MDDELLTIDQASKLLEIDSETIRRWIDRGLPVARGEGEDVLIARSELDAFLAREGQGQSRDAATEF